MQLPFALSSSEELQIDKRIEEFHAMRSADTKLWFSELCFCILTANAQARKAIAIQEELGPEGFLSLQERELAAVIRKHNHRFHNTKAHYIVQARKYCTIKDSIKNMTGSVAREFLVAHVKGLGYKEASHFLRNVGYSEVAIIDRHIIKFMTRYGLLEQQPKVITKKAYLELEEKLKQFNMPLDKLDLILWYHMTGTVLK